MVSGSPAAVDWAGFKNTIVTAAAAIGAAVDDARSEQFAVHARLLIDWNRRINLTAIADPLEMALKHYVDSIAPSALIPSTGRLLDIGSGAGFPGIPLKIMQPAISLTMIDARRKKVSFLKTAIRHLGLEKARACHVRAEDIPPGRTSGAAFDVVVSRAVTDVVRFVQLALPLVAADGLLMYFGGRPPAAAEMSILKDALERQDRPSVWHPMVMPYTLAPTDFQRHVLVVQRIFSA